MRACVHPCCRFRDIHDIGKVIFTKLFPIVHLRTKMNWSDCEVRRRRSDLHSDECNGRWSLTYYVHARRLQIDSAERDDLFTTASTTTVLYKPFSHSVMTLSLAGPPRSTDCVTVSVPHCAVFMSRLTSNVHGGRVVIAAAGDRRVNRDWCNWHLGRFSTPSKILLFLLLLYIHQSFYRPETVNEKPVYNFINGTSGLIQH